MPNMSAYPFLILLFFTMKLVLNSMHRYQPRVHLVSESVNFTKRWDKRGGKGERWAIDCGKSYNILLPNLSLQVKWREGMMASGAFVSDLESEYFRTFVFPETVFTAVTAYQNQLVSTASEFCFMLRHIFIDTLHYSELTWVYSTRQDRIDNKRPI